MRQILLVSLIFGFFCFSSVFSTKKAFAVENPLSVANNKLGIHILFPNELKPASLLVNSNGGDWGYVTIVVQAGDKDITKWQSFMDTAKKYHLIPIVRLATEGDYFNTKVWRRPTDTDILDFSNFLNSLDWPVKNRYIVVFNEVNRSEEWGGNLSPGEYAKLLSYTVTVFKSRNPDFFIISSGLDNAAPNQTGIFMNEYDFMRQMDSAVPGIFKQIDGLASHSYPNPGFSQLPSFDSTTGIDSFQYEDALAKNLSNKTLPVFITETGWSTNAITDDKAAGYYTTALNTVWKNPNIVAITPFLLQGSGSAFQQFSFLGTSGNFTKQYFAIKNFPKTKGLPAITISKVLAAETVAGKSNSTSTEPVRNFSDQKVVNTQIVASQQLKTVFKWLLKL